MDVVSTAKRLIRSGQFGDAFKVLEAGPIPPIQRATAQVLKSEVLEHIGRLGQSRTLAAALLKSSLSSADKATCECVLGRVCWDEGETDNALNHLQRAASLAIAANDLYRLCWVQIVLLIIIADRFGYEAAMPLLAEARATAIRAGDPQVIGALHVFVAKIDGKRGLINSARRHARFARQLLARDPNVWLEAGIENTEFAASIIRSDLEAARTHGLRAYDLAQFSDEAGTCCACLCNLGNLYEAQGEFDRAAECLERALMASPSLSENALISLQSLARVRLLQERFVECHQILEQIDASIQNDEDHTRYAYRYTELTRTQLMWREGHFAEAHAHADRVLESASRVRDGLLHYTGRITKAQVFLSENRVVDSLQMLQDSLVLLPSDSPELHAQYEQIFACASMINADTASAQRHYQRAKRIYEALRNRSGMAELERLWSVTSRASGDYAPSLVLPPAGPGPATRDVLHGVAALMVQSARGEFLAREIVALLSTTGCVEYAMAVVRSNDGVTEVLSEMGTNNQTPALEGRERRVPIGSCANGCIEVVFVPRSDVESAATINAIGVVVSTLHDLQRAREDREQRAALWQVEETPPQDGRAVSTGHIQEVMAHAKRIACTNVSVLVTGESGTGKEVVARAIHAYSDRAQKPFIPFNCTAVPREMLESQLFGHRRGAFTGADRDNPGVIRAARDGTLLLDEIGEMDLDMQPKLLRFLESGEICPLGESTPFSVNVRIVASTNSNLEALVKAGRFREDLFYRLNVIRLSIRPLRERRDEIPGLVRHFVARAAEEFRKGQIRIADQTVERLLLYSWPGNVRQLQNELRRMVAFAEPNTVLTVAAISEDILSVTPVPAPPSAMRGREMAVPLTEKLLPTLSRIEREMIKIALRDNHGKIDAAAKALGISRKGLYLKRQRLGL